MVMVPWGGALGSYFTDAAGAALVAGLAGWAAFWVAAGAAYAMHVSTSRQISNTGVST